MIGFVNGKILEIKKDSIVLLTAGGVGYDINVPNSKLNEYAIGQEASFYTYFKISENFMGLFGFERPEEKEFFEMLLLVSGVGPKSAMNILNLGSIDEIKSAIGREDVKYLTAVQGLGQKTAERLVVELKTKIKNQGLVTVGNGDSQVLVDVIEGLVTIGYGKEEVKMVVSGLDSKGKNTEELLRLALQKLSK